MANALTDPLLQALTRLVEKGEVEAACRIAGLACAQTRRIDSETTRRFNAFLHKTALHKGRA